MNLYENEEWYEGVIYDPPSLNRHEYDSAKHLREIVVDDSETLVFDSANKLKSESSQTAGQSAQIED